MGKAGANVNFGALCGILALCSCASLPNESQEETTSVPILTGTFIPGTRTASGNESNALNGENGGDKTGTNGRILPAYPVRDSRLASNNQIAWQTFLTTHWGASGFLTTPYDFAQLLDALAINIEISSGRQYVGLAESAFSRISGGLYNIDGSASYDAPAFMALGLAHLYNATASAAATLPHRNQYLSTAKNYFAPVLAAESFDGNNVSLGVYWNSQQDARRTAGTASAVLAAMQIYTANQDSNMLVFARRVYDAWFAAAVDPVAFTVADGVLTNGTIDPPKYTHNYGLMIEAAVGLHRVTGESRYLTHARGMAQTLMNTMTTGSGATTVLIEPLCTDASCGLSFIYRGMTLRALAQLAAIDGTNTDVQNVLNGTAAAIVASRNSTDGHYAADWSQGGTTTQDPAADLAVALALGYLAQSAPQQAAQTLSPTVGVASEGTLSVDLPILPGGDGLGAWATVGNFTSTAQTLTVPLLAPFAGDYTIVARYSVPGGSNLNMTITVPANASPQNVTFSPTYDVTKMTNTAPYSAKLGVGINNVVLAAASAPANALISTVTATPTSTVSGTRCNPTSILMLTSPGAAERICGAPTFSWSGSTGSQSQSDVFVDAQKACTAQGSARTCTLAQGVLAPGKHTWQVVEDGCRMSAVGTFDYAHAPPVTPMAGLTLSGGSTIIAWPTPAEAQKVDVTLNGKLVCGQINTTRCVVANKTLLAAGANTVLITATNACGQVQSTQKF